MANYTEVKLEGSGKHLESSFSSIAVEFSNIIYKGPLNNEKLNKSIMFRSPDLKSLLYNLMSKLNELLLNDLFLISNVQDLSINMIHNDYMLSSVIIGSKIKGNEINFSVKEILKNIYIKEDKDGCHIQVNLIVEEKNEV